MYINICNMVAEIIGANNIKWQKTCCHTKPNTCKYIRPHYSGSITSLYGITCTKMINALQHVAKLYVHLVTTHHFDKYMHNINSKLIFKFAVYNNFSNKHSHVYHASKMRVTCLFVRHKHSAEKKYRVWFVQGSELWPTSSFLCLMSSFS